MPDIDPASKSMDAIVALCKRRGFVYPASEIYGGINGFWDYGPLGTALKNNIRDHWWKHMVECPPIGPDGEPVSMVGLDSSIIQNPRAWEASGHVGGFSDPMVDCTESKKRYRADQTWVVGFYSVEHLTQNINRVGQFVDELQTNPGPNQQLEQEIMSEAYRMGMPDVIYGVEADSQFTALLAAVKLLTKRQIDELNIREFLDILQANPTENLERFANRLMRVHSLLDTPEDWPRISPATQRDTLTEPREFNLMFETFVGAIRDDSAKAYLRPETAQGIFLNYKNVLDTMRVKVPFGIAQIGKSFRNEVTPRNFIFPFA